MNKYIIYNDINLYNDDWRDKFVSYYYISDK